MAKRLAIGLTEEFADWECALLMAAARDDCGVAVTVLTPGGTGVTSIGGLSVASAGRLEEAAPENFDALVLAGGKIWQSPQVPDLEAPIRRFVAAGKPVAAICDATLELARLGLLDSRAHTSNFAGMLSQWAPTYHGEAHYRDQPRAVSDGGIITASGAAPVSFAAAVLAAIGADSQDLRDYLKLYGDEHR
ncbi:DJ-1/PfpI family protein [Rhizobium sp. TRM95111]|uniref:DJ-1/PfpI family protein n=1 Tax=Rhizobium alarense TaxID=2846851 RepID=UPI001F22ACEC|nr:DJ-1/PfpI family protein [Rhizobium alarense]MCF3638578.1 DJ-1/PfpI family protein [Rhizobium alarense]